METAWGEFTPAASSTGGLMIGLAALFYAAKWLRHRDDWYFEQFVG